MKKIIACALWSGVLAAGLQACKKAPTDDVQLNIRGGVMEQTVRLRVTEVNGAGAVPPGTQVSVTGPDAQYVYNLEGKRDFTLASDGTLQIGLAPGAAPSTQHPVQVTLRVAADGYLTSGIDVVFNQSGPSAQDVTVPLVNLSRLPAGLTAAVQTYTLTNGALSTGSTLKGKSTADSTYYDDGLTTVVLPQGTTFFYYKNEWEQYDIPAGISVAARTKYDTSYYTANDVLRYAVVPSVFYDTVRTEATTGTRRVRKRYDYTGTTLRVVAIYSSGSDQDWTVLDNWNGTNNAAWNAATQTFATISGAVVAQKDLLFKSATQKQLLRVDFIGKDAAGKIIDLLPNESSRWFTSTVLTPTAVNPKTGQPIRAGDSVDLGLDTWHGVISRAAIRSVNGQLRVQGQSTNFGYYYLAPYTFDFNYTFNASLAGAGIPDAENTQAAITLQLGSFAYQYAPSLTAGTVQWQGHVAALTPVRIASGACEVTYFGKTLKKIDLDRSGTGTYDLLAQPFSTALENLTTFYVTAVCATNPSKAISPTCSMSGTYDGKPFNVAINNGVWKTRGLAAGKATRFKGIVFNVPQDTTLSVSDVNRINIRSEEDVICKLLQ